MNLLKFNHWWKEKRVNPAFIGRTRGAFENILRYLTKRQILILKGLRRVGKTTLLYQTIDYLLEKKSVEPYHILYFSFDEEVETLDEILETYSREILKTTLRNSNHKYYLFLDEIQKLKNWANQVKIAYDLYPNIKILLSGSAALGLMKGVKESLAGRAFEFQIEPLDFPEYLKFRGIEYEHRHLNIFKGDIIKEVNRYINNSGFIEMIDENSQEVLTRYFQESIVERVIYRDIPSFFAISEPSLLFRILKIISSSPGMIVRYNNLANDLGKDQRTISEYCEYLKYCFLLRPLYQFSRNLLTSEKKLRKYYPTSTALTLALSDQPGVLATGKIMESLLVNSLHGHFFYRSSTKEEVDLILVKEEQFFPVEVKFKDSLNNIDLCGLRSFMKRFETKKSWVISKDLETIQQTNYGLIHIVPYWKFLLLNPLKSELSGIK